jgi:PAS domain S-box-containing protein
MSKILVLFEEGSDTAELSEKLQSMGHVVCEAKISTNSLQEHLKSSFETDYDLLILRINTEFGKTLVQLELISELSTIPVLPVISNVNNQLITKLRSLSFSSCIVWPASDEQLATSIQFCISKKDNERWKTDEDKKYAQRYRTITEMSVDGFMYLDREGSILDVNRKYCEMSGYSYYELLEMSVSDIEADMDKKEITYHIDKTILSGKDLFETHHRRKDGKIISVEISAIYTSSDSHGLFCFVRDISDRVRLENDLRESERSKSVLISNLPGIAYRCELDREWTMRFISQGCFELTGYKAEDLINNQKTSFNDLIEPEYRDYLWDKWQRILANGEFFRDEYRIKTASGKLKWVWEQGKGVADEQGNVIALEGFITDITQRKLMEERVKESEELFRTTLYSIGDGVITTDTNGCLQQMNTIAEELTGWSESEAKGKMLEDIFPIINEDSRSEVEIPVRKVLREGKIVGLANHTLLISRKGNEIPIADSGSPIKNASGDISGVVLVFRDQTEEREAQRALQESEARFRLLVEHAPEAIFVQTDNKFAYLNPAALELFGADSPEQLIGNFVVEQFHPDSRSQVKERISTLDSKKQAAPIMEEICLRMDGSSFVAEVSAVPLNYEGKNGALFFFRDITERKRAEEEILKAKLMSDNANRSKTEFLANTSHELKTPLSSIIGFSDLLLEGVSGDLNDKQTKYLKTIYQSGNLLLNLINNILDLSQIEFGEMELKLTRFDIVRVVQDVYSMMFILSERKGVSLELISNTDKLDVVADRIKVKEILYNLIDNALKFTPKNGYVNINIGLRDENTILISVADSGIGIGEDDVKRVFEPFYQVDGSSTRKYRGSGLGLAIIEKFVKMHGGNIWVESTIGEGSEFFFTIPVNQV